MLKRPQRYLVRVLLLVLILSSLFIFNWPYLKGDLGVSYSLKKYNVEPTAKPSVIEAATWINAHREEEGFFRTLWLPVDDELYDSLRWLDRYKFTADPITDPTGASYAQTTLEYLLSGDTTHVGVLLGQASVKYVILYLESPYLNGVHMHGDPRSLARILGERHDLELVINSTDYLIYENRDFKPPVTIHTPVIPLIKGNLVKEHKPSAPDSIIFDFEDWVATPEGWIQMSPAAPRIFRSTTPVLSGNYSVGLNPYSSTLGVALQSPLLTVDTSDVSLKFSVYIPRGQSITADKLYVAVKDASGFRWIRYVLATDNSTETWLVASTFNNLPTDRWLNFTVDNVYRDWQAVRGSADPIQMPISIVLVNNLVHSTVYFDDVIVSSRNLLLKSDQYTFTEIFNIIHNLISESNQSTQDVLPLYLESDAETFQFTYNSSIPTVILGSDDRIFDNAIYHLGVGSIQGHPLEEGGKAYFKFYAPKSSIYRTALLGSALSENVTINVNPLGNYQQQAQEEQMIPAQTKNFFLDRGVHELVVENKGAEKVDIQALVIFTEGSQELLRSMKPATVDSSIEKLSDVEYRIRIKTPEPTAITLAESYHPNWKIYAEGNPLHFRAYGWANGFYIDKPGEYSIRIFFKEQEMRDLYSGIWVASWLILTAMIVFTYRREITMGGRCAKKLLRNLASTL